MVATIPDMDFQVQTWPCISGGLVSGIYSPKELQNTETGYGEPCFGWPATPPHALISIIQMRTPAKKVLLLQDLYKHPSLAQCAGCLLEASVLENARSLLTGGRS